MNRKIIVLLILIGVFAIIGVSAYAIANGALEPKDEQNEISEVENSEVESSEVESSEVDSIVKDDNEGVDTSVDTEALSDSQLGDQTTDEYDENGDPRSESKYLDEDGDTVANYFDICPGVDDFSSDCETDAYAPKSEAAEEVVEQQVAETELDPNSDLDKNGDSRSESKYLDEDGDTIANYYDICPGIDDFSDECAEL